MEKFIKFIEQTIETLQKEEKALAESARKDEANLVRIKMNIYDICKTVYGVCARMPEKNQAQMQEAEKWQSQARAGIVQELKGDAATLDLYFGKLDAISASWRLSLEKAKAHGDVEKQVIEESKLAVVEEVKAKFLALCGE